MLQDSRAEDGHPTSALPRQEPGTWERILYSLPIAFLVVFGVALANRLLYLAEVAGSPDFNSLILDAQWYDVEAVRINAEGWFPPDAFFRAPGYPYVLALIYRLGGNALLPVRILQIVLASLSAGLALTLAWRVYGRAAGWVAGILAATFGTFIYFSTEILGTALVVFTSLASLLLLIRAESGGKRRSWFLAGLALGFSAIVRPTILLFGLFVLFWAKGRRTGLPGWGRAAAVAAGMLVWLLPVTIVNYVASGEAVFIAHQGGVNYFIGNNPQSDGKTAAGPGAGDSELLRSVGKTQDTVYLGAKIVADRATGGDLTPAEVSRFWFAQATRFIRSRPGDWARLQGRKLYYFWNGTVINNNRDIGSFVEANSRSLRLPHPGFWLVGPLGLAGLGLCFRRGRSSRLFGLFVIAQMVAVVGFFVCERFRMPAAMGLTILAALAAVTVFESLRRREWKSAVPLALAVTGLFWATNTGGLGIERDRDAPVHLFNQATAYMEQALYNDAIDTYRKVLELRPMDAKAHYALGSAYLAVGLYDRALSSYRRATGLDPSLAASVHNDLGVYYIMTDRLDRAEEELDAARESDPGYALAGLNLAHVYQSTGRRSLALEEYARILEMRDVHPEQKSVALAEIALSLAEAGRLDEAREQIEQAARFDRANELVHLYRGQILAHSGDPAGAVREWRQLVETTMDERIQAEAERRISALNAGNQF